MRAMIMLSGSPLSVEVEKMNSKTMLVRLPDGNVIKRHLMKHTPLHESIGFKVTERKVISGFFRRLWFGLFGGLRG